MGIKTIPQPAYSPDLAPSDFWLFPNLKGCHYERIEEMKEAVTNVIDMLTQEDFQKLLEQYNNCITAEGEFHVCTINKSAHTKKSRNLFNDPLISIYMVKFNAKSVFSDWNLYIAQYTKLQCKIKIIFKHKIR